jgi:hypothetical protein
MVQRATRERWWERRPPWLGVATLVMLGLVIGTFLGVELWGRSTLGALGVYVLVIALIVVVLRH